MFEDLAGRLHEAETKTRDAEKVWLKYVERVKNYSNTVIHHSRNSHLPTNTGFLQEKEQASLGDSKKPKSLDVFPLSTKPQLKPETTLEPEVLPKSLRVPLALEDYMATEKLGKEWAVRCLLCARQGKQFCTANTGDMTIHVQRVHQQLLPLISEAKGEEKKKLNLKKIHRVIEVSRTRRRSNMSDTFSAAHLDVVTSKVSESPSRFSTRLRRQVTEKGTLERSSRSLEVF